MDVLSQQKPSIERNVQETCSPLLLESERVIWLNKIQTLFNEFVANNKECIDPKYIHFCKSLSNETLEKSVLIYKEQLEYNNKRVPILGRSIQCINVAYAKTAVLELEERLVEDIILK
jgi:hypothetical protein